MIALYIFRLLDLSAKGYPSVFYKAFAEFYNNIIKKTGESKDRKNKINCLCNKQLKNPNISQFTRLLLSKGIHKIDGTLNSLEVKLGLYTT